MLATCLLTFSSSVQSQQPTKSKLFTDHLQSEFRKDTTKAYQFARRNNLPIVQHKNGNTIRLVRLAPNGLPEYVSTESNVNAAHTTGTSALWTGGISGLNLSGVGTAGNLMNKMAVWDGGVVRTTHDELIGRVTMMDNAATLSDHATHVAGTMIGRGVNAAARGMAHGATGIYAFDFNNAEAEMNSYGNSLLLSNHSYGTIAGWYYNNNRWEFYGEWEAFEDYNFGYYSSQTQMWDSISFNNPYYLMVKSSGNNRSQGGPAVGAAYWRRSSAGAWVQVPAREPGISFNNGYDIISTYGTAKNNLCVGAVNAIATGYTKPADVVISGFSSWGPTDDGRIKPDIVGNGVGLTSSVATANNSYSNMSGTSMSAPNVTGSLLLLQELYSKLNSNRFIRSATLRGLAIHTAFEAGTTVGPDYKHGWGLLNTAGAADVIRNHQNNHVLAERRLVNGADTTFTVVASGNGPLVVTICWTDPPGMVDFANRYNNRTPKLVNDLDVRVTAGTNVFQPWRLNPEDPEAAATTGDNIRDNVEKIEIPNAVAGATYTIKISHKGNLRNALQDYSLLMSGVNGTAYCASQPATTADSRIQSFTFGSILNNAPAGCTQYTDATSQTTTVVPMQSVPLSVAVGTCGGGKDKMVKVFIDWNGNGSFADAGEAVATSGILSGNASYSTNVIVPGNIKPGLRSRIRVVLMETQDATAIQACGTYAGGGETQDYTIIFGRAGSDVAPIDIAGLDNVCGVDVQHVSVRVQNAGTATAFSNRIFVQTVVKQNNAIVATLLDTIATNLIAGEIGTLVHKQGFATLPNTTYTLETSVSMVGEGNTANNTATKSFTTRPAYAGSLSASGQICAGGTTANFFANPAPAASVIWYAAQNATIPVAAGNSTTQSPVPANSTLFAGANDFAGKIGVPDKMHYNDGGYNAFTPGVVISVGTPLIIESARIYTGNSGRLTFHLLDATTYNLVSTVSMDVPATLPVPQQGAYNVNTPDDAGMVAPLNLKVPAAGEYILRVNFEKGATLFRNNLIPLGNVYPMTVPGIMSITGHEAAATTTEAYYYFYDMKIRTLACPSGAPRTAVVASQPLTPVISANGNVLSSSATAGTIRWFRNDTLVANATSATYTATEAGNYKVEHVVNGCVFLSPAFAHVVTSVTTVNASAIDMRVTPNPSAGRMVLQYTVPLGAKNVAMQVLSYDGKAVANEKLPSRAGAVQHNLDLTHLAPGVYLLKVFIDNKQYLQKVLIQR